MPVKLELFTNNGIEQEPVPWSYSPPMPFALPQRRLTPKQAREKVVATVLTATNLDDVTAKDLAQMLERAKAHGAEQLRANCVEAFRLYAIHLTQLETANFSNHRDGSQMTEGTYSLELNRTSREN